MSKKEIVKHYKKIKEDFLINPDIMNAEDDRVRKVKEVINTRLSVVDKTIILLYIDFQSLRKLGKAMGMSHMTARKEVLRIKGIILEEYKKIK